MINLIKIWINRQPWDQTNRVVSGNINDRLHSNGVSSSLKWHFPNDLPLKQPGKVSCKHRAGVFWVKTPSHSAWPSNSHEALGSEQRGEPGAQDTATLLFFKKRQHCIHLLGMDANSNTCKSPLSSQCSVDIIANTCLPAVSCIIFFYYLRIKKH